MPDLFQNLVQISNDLYSTGLVLVPPFPSNELAWCCCVHSETHMSSFLGVSPSAFWREALGRETYISFLPLKNHCDSCPSVWGVNKKDCFQVIYIHSKSLFWMQFSWISQERKNMSWRCENYIQTYPSSKSIPLISFFKLKSILISKKSGRNFFIIENTTPVKYVTFHQISFIDFKYFNVHQDNRNLEVSTTHILPSKVQNVFSKEVWVVK